MAKFLGLSKVIVIEITLRWSGLGDLRWQRPVRGSKSAI